MYFQDIIQELNKYWAEQGCLIQQPYDMEVGAGTFHPATLLRSLGPEPWRPPMFSLRGDRPTAAMAKTPIACSTIINIRW